MFTGLVQTIGEIAAAHTVGADSRISIAAPDSWLQATKLGDSISVNGVCLTVTDFSDSQFSADVSVETLKCTTLSGLGCGQRVNLEKALRVGDAIGGHLVSGHIDCVSELVARYPDGRSERMEFAIPPGFAKLLAPKGSVCVDGTSLTVNEVDDQRFGVNIVPHTLQSTIAGDYEEATTVNLEIDLIARYVARILGHATLTGNDDGEN